MAETSRVTGWLRWVLVISLALNLLVLGLLGSWWLKWGLHGGHHPPRVEHAGGPLTRALSHEDRRAIGRDMHAAYRDRGENRGARIVMLAELIRAEPFDRAAVMAQLTAQRDALNERLSLGQSLLLDRLDQMDTAERAAYADRLEEELKRRRKKRH